MVRNRIRLTEVRIGLAAAAMAACGGPGEVPSFAPVADSTSMSSLTSSTSHSLTASTCDDDGDATDRDKGDRGPMTTLGSTGRLEIGDFFVGGVFYSNDEILRAQGHPECVVHLEAAEKPFAAAGTLTVSSDLVGTPGGALAPFVINPDGRNEYDEFPDLPLFNFPDGTKVHVELAGSSAFPPIRGATLRSSPFGVVNITAPRPPDTGRLAIDSRAPLRFKWDVPTTHHHASLARHRQSVSVRLFVVGPERWGQLYCSWPIEDGHGKVPVVLLKELRKRAGGTGKLDAALDVYSGEFKEIATAASSYVVFVTTDFGTTFPRSTMTTFE